MNQVEQLKLQAELASLPMDTLARICARQDWVADARHNQLPPDDEDWFVWLLLAGRGFGKTRTGAEHVWWESSNQPWEVALIGPTNNDVRKTMFEGESGLIRRIPQYFHDSGRVHWNRSALELWVDWGGSVGRSHYIGYSSEEPERLRGPQHHHAWCDELCAWKYPEETWDMMMFGLRLGDSPRTTVTTTPKPGKLLRDILSESDTRVSRGSTLANARNLPRKILKKLVKKYNGTRLGRQELFAEVLDENPYALWQPGMIEETRIRRRRDIPGDLERIVVAVDPPVSSGEDADECGVVVAGKIGDRYYVLEDVSEQGLSPAEWAEVVVSAYHRWQADRVVAEVNQGGEMVRHTIETEDADVPVTMVHAKRGKVLRAEPVSALYERQRVHHVGVHAYLESQMCDFTSDFDPKKMGYSPDRVDALVYAILELEGEAGYGMMSVV